MFRARIESVERSDRDFYELVIQFTVRVLEGAFERSDCSRLHDEINRLFRTNAFNIANRLQF